jgi:hypothetical protein
MWPLKTDSVPVRSNGYKSGSYLELTQRCRIACGQDLVVVMGVKGSGENFSDSEILKNTTVGSLQYDDYTVLLFKAPVRSNMDI